MAVESHGFVSATSSLLDPATERRVQAVVVDRERQSFGRGIEGPQR
jgi:hypothetical protein